jgi:hypothetical protein
MAKKEYEDDYKFPDEQVAEEAEAKAAAEDSSDEFEIEVEDDTPEADRDKRPMRNAPEEVPEDELSTYDEKVQSRIKKFTKGYHDERRAKEAAFRERQAAEELARQLYEENKKLQEQLATGSQAYIEQHKTAAESELAMAERKYKEAYEAGDADAIVTAQRELARATMKIERAQELKPVQVQERKFELPSERQQAQTQPNVTPRLQQWLEDNGDWWGKDDEMTAAAMGLDKKLQREYGSDYVGTEEYFRTIDATMRKRFPEHFGSQEDDAPKTKASEPAEEEEPPRRAQKPATVVAPATRSTPPKRVRLKESQVSIAKRLGIPLELYAKKVAELNGDQ